MEESTQKSFFREAMKLNKQHMGRRYIDLFRSSVHTADAFTQMAFTLSLTPLTRSLCGMGMLDCLGRRQTCWQRKQEEGLEGGWDLAAVWGVLAGLRSVLGVSLCLFFLSSFLSLGCCCYDHLGNVFVCVLIVRFVLFLTKKA